MNEDDLPDCEECLRLMVEALAKSAADPQNIALLPSEEAEKATNTFGSFSVAPMILEQLGEAPRKEG